MNENKKLSKSKIYAIVGVTLLILTIVGSAYAYYQASATASIAGEAAGAGLDLDVTKISTSANKNLIPLTNTVEMLTKAIKGYGNTGSTFDETKSCIDKNGNTACQIYEISLTNSSSVSVSFNGGATLSGDNTPNIACAVMDSNISISSNNTCVGKKTIANNDEVLSGQTKKYYVIVYVNNLDVPQSDNGVFNGTITFTSSSGVQLKARFEDIVEPLEGTATQILSSFTKTGTVTSNSISHDIDKNHQLIKDEAGNIRFYGTGITSSSTTYIEPNNYIDIGDRDSSSNPILWRIIGVFKGIDTCNDDACSTTTKKDLIKVIRSEAIGNYAWDSSNVNNWTTASLKTYLNSGEYYTAGITDTAKNKIANGVWNIGGYNNNSVYPNQIYTYERGTTVPSGRPTTWTGKIALAYPSDYGYATDLSQCNQNLYDYDSSANNYACRGNNWMWYAITGATFASSSGTNSAWLLTPDASYANYAWFVNTTGFVGSIRNVDYARAVGPVLYLDSEQAIESGSGTSIDPYVLSA